MTVEQQEQPISEGLRKSILELNKVTERRERIGRHIAEQSLIDGYFPLEKPRSNNEEFRSRLNQRVIGQPSAVEAIIQGLDKKDIRGEYDRRPVSVNAFLGPTGVGKSEMAKVLAELLADGEPNLIKIDCSNYSHGHEISNLTGSPYGYVGSSSPGLLSKDRVEKPGTVILFDEFEKGSNELNNLMLQIMEDGELPMKDNTVTNFREANIIITSNLGAERMRKAASPKSVGFGTPHVISDQIELANIATQEFQNFVPPEFLNRIDNLIVFQSLDEKSLIEILQVQVDLANAHYESTLGIRISLSDATISHLISAALQKPEFGARPLIRVFKQSVQTTLGQYHGSNDIQEGHEIRVFHRNELSHDHPSLDDREFIFAMKENSSIRRKVEPGVVQLSKDLVPLDFSNIE